MRGISTLSLVFLTSALATMLLLMTSGPRLCGQDPQGTQPPTNKSLKIVRLQQTQPHSGAQMFKEYCASCHGADGRGNGPAVGFLKTPPPDLRMMTQRNNGRYPSLQVKAILTFGPGTHAHGALDMPTWGPLFRSLDGSREEVVTQRIYNLGKFIESIQQN